MRSALDLTRGAKAAAQRHRLAADAVLAVALAVAAFVSVDAVYGEVPANDASYSHGWTAGVVISMLAITLPLAGRRRFPFSVAAVVVTAFLVARIVVHVPETDISLLAVWVMLYSVAVHGDRRSRTPILALCYVAIVAEIVRELFFVTPTVGGPPLARGFTLFYNLVVLSLPWVLGAAISALRDRQAALAAQTVELQLEREQNARQAVFAERVRIARELHDVVAHHVSVIGVQAAGARKVLDRQPARAAEALSAIEESSRRAVAELHRLLGFLRHDRDTDEVAPQPGLAQLGDLIAEADQADLTVALTIRGETRLLSPTLELSAYRIIQEALTNTRKHSTATTATVRLQYEPTKLQIDVADDGPHRELPPTRRHAGHGLIGMRERAALHGGHLDAGPGPRGGFVVRVAFPLNSGAT